LASSIVFMKPLLTVIPRAYSYIFLIGIDIVVAVRTTLRIVMN
jgi:hypothetical protein